MKHPKNRIKIFKTGIVVHVLLPFAKLIKNPNTFFKILSLHLLFLNNTNLKLNFSKFTKTNLQTFPILMNSWRKKRKTPSIRIIQFSKMHFDKYLH